MIPYKDGSGPCSPAASVPLSPFQLFSGSDLLWAQVRVTFPRPAQLSQPPCWRRVGQAGSFEEGAMTAASRMDLFIRPFNALRELRAFILICFQFVPSVSNRANDLNLDTEVILSLKSPAHLPLFSDPLSPLTLKATILKPSGRKGSSLRRISAPGLLPCLVTHSGVGGLRKASHPSKFSIYVSFYFGFCYL